MATDHFTDAELACRCRCGTLPPQAFQDLLERLRVDYAKPIYLSSAARCPDYNSQVSHTGLTGPHTKGAIDALVYHGDAIELAVSAYLLGWRGFGWSQKGPHGSRFLHLDRRPKMTTWSY